MRTFDTGATRDDATHKLDYEGYISPLVLKRFAEYMHKHQVQPDGQLRASDNWQKGMPLDEYMKSMMRHEMDVWLLHRGWAGVATQDIMEALCALFFNVQGMMHELLVGEVIDEAEERPMTPQQFTEEYYTKEAAQ